MVFHALFSQPFGISISPDNTYALMTDNDIHLIRKIVFSTLSVSNFIGRTRTTIGSTNGVGTRALFNYPTGIDISPDGTYALVVDRMNNAIRQIYYHHQMLFYLLVQKQVHEVLLIE